MGKKAIIRLPKGKVANNIQARYVDGEIQVRYDVEDKFKPKDGDFLIREKDSIVVIYKDTDYSGGVVSYAGGCCKSKGHISTRTDTGWGYTENYRPATFSETFDFLVRLENEYGKAWDSKNKKLVDVIKPVPGDFLISKNKGIFIFINKIDGLYCGVYELKDILGNHNGYSNSVKVASMLEFRYATEEEKKEFLDFIRMKFSKEWNSEKLCFEDVFNPKDGDFLHNKDNDTTVIYKGTYESSGGIITYAGAYSNTITFDIGRGWGKTESYRYATLQEKQALLDRLEKECGKRWNPDTKQIEDIRWKPKQNEYYFYINPYGEISKTIYDTAIDSHIIGIGNSFKTEEDAKPYADKIKEIFKNSKPE